MLVHNLTIETSKTSPNPQFDRSDRLTLTGTLSVCVQYPAASFAGGLVS